MKILENIEVRTNNTFVKEGKTIDVINFVRFVVRSYELETLSSSIEDELEAMTKSGVTVEGATLENLCEVFEDDASLAVNTLEVIKLIRTVQSHLSELPSEAEWEALSGTDKNLCTLLAHMNYERISLENLCNKVDLKNASNEYFESGNLSKAKKLFCNAWYNVLGKDGNLFFGLKLKNSDIPEEDIRSALATFRKGAKMHRNKDKAVTRYDWNNTAGKQADQNRAVSTLFSVLIDKLYRGIDAVESNKPVEPVKTDSKVEKPVKGEKSKK